MVDLDADSNVVGFDVDHASRKLDLTKVETIALPPAYAAGVREAPFRRSRETRTIAQRHGAQDG